MMCRARAVARLLTAASALLWLAGPPAHAREPAVPGWLEAETEAVYLALRESPETEDPFAHSERQLEQLVAERGDLQLAPPPVVDGARAASWSAALAAMDRERLRAELIDALDARLNARRALARADEEANRRIREALAAQTLLDRMMPVEGEGSAGLLAAIERRLPWLERAATEIGQAEAVLAAADGDAAAPSDPAVVNSQDDPRVVAARQLLLQVGGEVAIAEQERLIELRRHLEEARRLSSAFERHSATYLDRLLLPALAAVTGETELRRACERAGRPFPAEGEMAAARELATAWADGGEAITLGQLVERAAPDGPGRRAAGSLVSRAMTILSLGRPVLREALEQPEAELERHRRRLAEIDSPDRRRQIERATEELRDYYPTAGEPAQRAHRLLFAAQMLATTLDEG